MKTLLTTVGALALVTTTGNLTNVLNSTKQNTNIETNSIRLTA